MKFSLPALFARKQTATMTTLDLYRAILGGAEARTGIKVTHQTALECSVALAAARVIANGLSSIPFRLMQKTSAGRGPAEGEDLYTLFEDAPNEFQSPVDFFEQIGLHLVFCRNAFVWINRVSMGVAELLPFEPGKVTMERKGTKTSYKISTDNGKQVEVPAEEMWHLRGLSWDGWSGLDGVKLAREAIGLSMAAELHGSSSFRNGARVGGFLTTEQVLSKEQRAALRESWQENYAGAENAGKTPVMSNGMKYVTTAFNNVDSQWHETRVWQVEEICRHLGVLPIMVGYSDKATTYASADAMYDAHIRYTMLPYYRKIEKSASLALLTPEQRKGGFYFKFFPQALLRSDPKTRGQFYKDLYGIGAISPNEIRELEDMNPYEGGDQRRVPLNMTDAANPEPASAPAASPPPSDSANPAGANPK